MKAQGPSLVEASCLVLHPHLPAPLSSSWHSRPCAALVAFSQPISSYVLSSSTNTYLLAHISLCIFPPPSVPPFCPPVCTTLLDDTLRDFLPTRWAHKQGVRKVMEEQQLPSHIHSQQWVAPCLHHYRLKAFLKQKLLFLIICFCCFFRLPDPYGVIMQDTMSKILTLSHSIDNISEDKSFPSLST